MKDPKDDAKELSGIELSSGWRNSDDRGVPDMSIGVETSICGATEIPPLSPLLPSLPPFSATSMPRPIAGASTMVSADGGLGSSSEARLPCSADCAVPIFRLRSLYETAEGNAYSRWSTAPLAARHASASRPGVRTGMSCQRVRDLPLRGRQASSSPLLRHSTSAAISRAHPSPVHMARLLARAVHTPRRRRPSAVTPPRPCWSAPWQRPRGVTRWVEIVCSTIEYVKSTDKYRALLIISSLLAAGGAIALRLRYARVAARARAAVLASAAGWAQCCRR
eukprot:COSAG02_NODE_1795_length_10906_cov_5.562084_4_plen_279_part_00